jgi:uracil phosphoribosyltransferase
MANQSERLFVLQDTPSVGNRLIAELRDVEIQKNSARFRDNLEKLGHLLAFEMSKAFPYQTTTVTTPLGISHIPIINKQVVLATILRAGIPLYQGVLHFFDQAESAFIGAYRIETEAGQEGVQVNMDYLASPGLEGKILVLIDPMLATGKSLVKACHALMEKGTPATVHVVSAIASKPGIAYVLNELPGATIWAGAVDDALNTQSFIVPGLGDAGDLSFGAKI